MPASKAQQKAVNKYMAANYDRINLTVPRGQKETIRTHAAARGESVNAFIARAIRETLERDQAQSPEAGPTSRGQPLPGGGGGFPLLICNAPWAGGTVKTPWVTNHYKFRQAQADDSYSLKFVMVCNSRKVLTVSPDYGTQRIKSYTSVWLYFCAIFREERSFSDGREKRREAYLARGANKN